MPVTGRQQRLRPPSCSIRLTHIPLVFLNLPSEPNPSTSFLLQRQNRTTLVPVSHTDSPHNQTVAPVSGSSDFFP